MQACKPFQSFLVILHPRVMTLSSQKIAHIISHHHHHHHCHHGFRLMTKVPSNHSSEDCFMPCPIIMVSIKITTVSSQLQLGALPQATNCKAALARPLTPSWLRSNLIVAGQLAATSIRALHEPGSPQQCRKLLVLLHGHIPDARSSLTT
jgi:hypothetical protein